MTSGLSKSKRSFFDKCFKDSKGKVVLAQKWNLPIAVWAVSFVLDWLFGGTFGQITSVIAFGAIFTWAWMELFDGVNYFRRALGLIALVLIIWNKV